LRDEELGQIEGAIRSANASAIIDEELDKNEFDHFLMEREAKQSGAKYSPTVLAGGAAAEWQRVKDITRSMTAGKKIDGNPFEWTPYSAYYPDFLRFKDVAASFFDNGNQNGVPQACRIRFDRRSPAHNSPFVDEKSPIDPEVWSPEPQVEGKNIVWSVKELVKIFTSSELASQVAIRWCASHREEFPGYATSLGTAPSAICLHLSAYFANRKMQNGKTT
jgi:hypothetical protein